MEKEKFDLGSVNFCFGSVTPADPDNGKMTELAGHLYNEEIDAYMGTLSDDVVSSVRMYADHLGIEDATVKKCEDFSVNIYKDGALLVNAQICALVNDEDLEKIMPDGNPAHVLVTEPGYTWKEYENLEKLAMEQDVQFGADVEAVTETDNAIERQ